MRSFQEASEFSGRKQSDVAGSPPPDNHHILLVDHLIENAGEIFTQTRICCFPRHHSPQSVLYSIPVRHGDPLHPGSPTATLRGRLLLSQADLSGVISFHRGARGTQRHLRHDTQTG